MGLAAVVLGGCSATGTRLPQGPAGQSANTQRQLLAAEVDDWLMLGRRSRDPVNISNTRVNDESAKLASERLYSLQVVDMPVAALLVSIAAEASLDLLLTHDFEKQVSLTIEDKPLQSVLRRLSLHVPMAWRIVEGVLEVGTVDAYVQSYSVNYLNQSRTTQSSVGLATQVGSINLQLDSASSSGFENSSRSLIENETVHDFWHSLSQGLALIVGDEAGLEINREAALVTLRATAKQHREVQRYLDLVQQSAGRQVQIQAVIVEVTLSDDHQAGIDWRLLSENSQGDSIGFSQVFQGLTPPGGLSSEVSAIPSGLFSATLGSGLLGSAGKISATLALLEEFGDVRVLSRPQINTVNNQSAVLKVVDNHVYFTLKVDRRQGDETDEITTESEIHTVPVGLVMSVTPYISAQGEVILSVRPTISRILGFVDDPNPALAAANVRNGVPEIQIREMESVLKVENGKAVMIGGLMQHQTGSDRQSLPGLGSLPGIGRLFQNHQVTGRKSELLVFLQPTVL